MIVAIAFYVFAAVAVASGLMVTLARNPVHSVLWLILTFFSAAGLFVIAGAEFVAMLLVIVYVGAVMVLFLFVVMMLDVDFSELRGHMAQHMNFGVLICLILAVELALGVGAWQFGETALAERAALAPAPEAVSNTRALGMILYDRYFLAFQAAGLVLFVAMIGAIVLTLRIRTDVKRQNVLDQIWRRREESVELRDVKPGQGV